MGLVRVILWICAILLAAFLLGIGIAVMGEKVLGLVLIIIAVIIALKE